MPRAPLQILHALSQRMPHPSRRTAKVSPWPRHAGLARACSQLVTLEACKGHDRRLHRANLRSLSRTRFPAAWSWCKVAAPHQELMSLTLIRREAGMALGLRRNMSAPARVTSSMPVPPWRMTPSQFLTSVEHRA